MVIVYTVLITSISFILLLLLAYNIGRIQGKKFFKTTLFYRALSGFVPDTLTGEETILFIVMSPFYNKMVDITVVKKSLCDSKYTINGDTWLNISEQELEELKKISHHEGK